MKLGARLELKQSQRLVMTPQLQQSLRVLNMSVTDVAAFVDAEIERNPLLKLAEEPAAPIPAPTAAPGGDTRPAIPAETGALGPRTQATQGAGRATAISSDAAGFEDYTAATESLRDHLLAQLGATRTDAPTRAIAEYLVDELDEAGYLRADLTELRDRLGAGEARLDQAVELLQSLDPAGVGARDLAECFALQLRRRDRFDPAMEALVANLGELAAHRLDRLCKICGVDREDLEDMIEELRRLDPRPGAALAPSIAETLIPEIIVSRNEDGGWKVEVNPDALPRVLVDKSYEAELSGDGDEASAFLTACRKEADWLIRLLDQRAGTILKVATEIVRRQSRYFEYGAFGLTPMRLKDIAEAIGMHESTVSRVTANKHLACPQGVLPMKFFFTQGIETSDGGDSISAEAVRARIKGLIDNENPDQPLSDEAIVTALKQSGVNLARRTVAKYRDVMNIPTSSKRKRMKASRLRR